MKTLLVCCCLVVVALASPTVSRTRRGAVKDYKMCVPEDLMPACEIMVKAEPPTGAKVTCVSARDRMHCMQLVQQRGADFVPVDPEDMWVASDISDQDFEVFAEIRTKEEPDADYRYEAVAVIHKDLNIKSVKDIKGLKSCHTGVGRNVGYKIPITKLRQMGVLGSLNDQSISPRENELKALSTTFSKACLVGKWSPEPDINKKWKKTYANLCALCEKPDVCDYPDNFSGYDGALRCLAHNGGQIAWTKVYYVKKFFGMPIGVVPAVPTNEKVDKFAYLCPDGTKKPITENTPCRWAARPWQGFMTNADHATSIQDLRDKLRALDKLGEDTNAPWLDTVLTLNNKLVVKDTNVIAPKKYLDNANYTDVIERDYGPPKKTIRFCVTSDDEMKKCRDLSKVAFSRTIRPQFDCILESSIYDCLKIVRDNGADIISLDAGFVDIGQREYNLKPIVGEEYGEVGGMYYSVAVVKKGTKYNSFADLRGARSCHTGFGRTAGYNIPLYTLLKAGLIKKSECPYPKALSEFFSGGSCLPGALLVENNPDGTNPEKLCSKCVGNVDSTERSKKHICAFDHSEAYYGYSGAFRCLSQGHGDVAFVKHVTVQGNTDGNNKAKWAVGLKSTDYELLCPNGGRAPVTDFAKCNLAKVPSHMVVTSNAKNDNEIEEIRHALVGVGQMFSKRSDLFRLFGAYNGKHDLLFKDYTTSLVSVDLEDDIQKQYTKILHEVRACSHADS